MKSVTLNDPLRLKFIEMCEELVQHTQMLRDYTLTPGNLWLAKNELQQVGQNLSDLEQLLVEIRDQDELAS